MNENAMIGVYGILQKELRREEQLGEYAQPLKSKNDDESDTDAKGLYKFLSAYLVDVSERDLNERKGIFNDIVNSLTQEYFLNNFLLAIFMLENFVGEDGSVPQKITLLPKIRRLIKHMQKGIIEEQDNALDIIKDSKIAASNICEIFRGGFERTKAMREWSAAQWREAAKGKYA